MAKLDVDETMWASADGSITWWGIVGARYITASCASFTRLRDSGAASAECASGAASAECAVAGRHAWRQRNCAV